MVLDSSGGISAEEQEYSATSIINEIRSRVETWRSLKPDQWKVTPVTAQLLHHWRSHDFQGARPFFCQIEAVETAIWLSEVAPKSGKAAQGLLSHIRSANAEANPDLFRVALKLCTGAGKTTVMAMLIAWQALNAVRLPDSKMFSRGFLLVAPGITIRDRLRVLLPNDPESYFRTREIVPAHMLADMDKAKVVITNYHAFKRKERLEAAKTTRRLVEGRRGHLDSLETEGEMIRRVMPDLMGMKNVVVINDEAHHCYREKPDPTSKLKGEDKKEADKNNEAARLWISGIETVKRKLGVGTVYDLSATPFFLSGSGYVEGTLFPWVVSDFSLIDGIESGIVKLPRVPISDNIPGGDAPKFRNLWDHIGKDMPKKGRGKSGNTVDPLSIPAELETALQALYGHYRETFDLWAEAKVGVEPVFIVVCNNTSSSKLVYDYISGFFRETEPGKRTYEAGRLGLFRNYDDGGGRLPRPRTLLIDSEQLESGDALDKDFRELAADEIERFKREIIDRTENASAADNISDQDLLREVMNTVGKPGKLGESIRCVVSVSMLTEGWDANTVTHILGVRAFGTQLLCEQVVGRGLRRQSYRLNDEGLFDAEYADILGIPFDFTAKPVVSKPVKPKPTTQVHAVRPERDHLEITFPRIEGYRVDLPKDRLTAKFTEDSTLELNPALVGPSITRNEGIIGEGVDLTLAHLDGFRRTTVLYHLARHLMTRTYREAGEDPKLHLFGQFKAICREWLEGGYLRCVGGTYEAQLIYTELADMACEKIKAAIAASQIGGDTKRAILDPYNPTGSTSYVNFPTTKDTLWKTDPRKCHVNFVVCDSDWEAEFCRVAEAHPRVISYVKNQSLGFEVPYVLGAARHRYLPDFIVRIDDGRPDPLNLVVEIKGYRGEDAKVKAETMRAYWVPGVNRLGTHGRWDFVEFRSVYEIQADFDKLIAGFLAPVPA